MSRMTSLPQTDGKSVLREERRDFRELACSALATNLCEPIG